MSSAGSRYGGFHSHGGSPRAGWFLMENLHEMDDLKGYLHFRKPPQVEFFWAQKTTGYDHLWSDNHPMNQYPSGENVWLCGNVRTRGKGCRRIVWPQINTQS